MELDLEPISTKGESSVQGGGLDLEPLNPEKVESKRKPEEPAREFEQMSPVERGIRGPTAAIESAVRGPLSFITSTVGRAVGTAQGALEEGTLEGAIKGGREQAEKWQIPAYQKGSAYFDEQISKGIEWFRDNVAGYTMKTGKPLDQQTISDLKREAKSRSIGEGLFDELLVALLKPKGRGRIGEKAEEPIQGGPQGPQGELFENENATPPSMMGQENRSPYNLAQQEIEKLNRELNPEAEQRIEGQGELFTGYNPAEKYTVEPSQGGGRFRAPDMEKQATSDMYTQEEKALGGATEQSNLPADQFGPKEARSEEPIPFTPLGQTLKGRKQGGAMDPDLLTMGVRKLLDSEGFKQVMDRFRGTFSNVAIDHAVRQSTDPKSRETIVFMSPDKFLELAKKRIAMDQKGNIVPYDQGHAEFLRRDIRRGIEGETGLNQIPELILSTEEAFSPGAGIHSVVAHEGRHRADVFKEKGLDLMPVRVTHDTLRWGERPVEDFPRKVISENGKFTEFPSPEFWGKDNLPDLDFTSPNRAKFGQGGGINPRIFSKNPTKAILDARDQFTPERRPLKDILNKMTKDVEDISTGFKIASNAMIDKTASILSQNKGPVGKFIKWVVDNNSDIERTKDLNIERDLYGEKYEAGKGGIRQPFEKRVTGDGILSKWTEAHKTKQGKQEIREMQDKAIENIGRDLTHNDFRTDKQYDIYRSIQQGLTNVLDRVNKVREEAGMKPIQRLPGYLPAEWTGDYRVHVFDGLGNKVQSYGFKNIYQANMAVKALRKEHPDLEVRDAEHVKKADKTKINDLSAFEEAIRALGKDDPTSLALQKTMVQLRASRGFGRHGLQRKGVLGFLGMEKGDVGVRNMRDSLEQYVRQANNYIANMQRAKLSKQIDELPLEVQEKMPNALDWAGEYMASSKGANIDKLSLISDGFGALSKMAGTGASAPMRWLRQTSSVASLYFLTTPRFIVSQMAQHLNAFPKYVQLRGEGNFRSPVASWYKGWENFISPDEHAIAGTNWAQRNGYLDSALVAMLEMKMGDTTFSPSGLAGTLKDAVSNTFGQIEKKLVRMPTFLAMEYGLRDSIKDPAKRYETAAQMMDYYMVHYGRQSSPMMYSKAGIVGEAARTFKQYSHNAWGQFFEYLNYSHQEGGSVAPLVAHVGLQTAIAGLKGTVLVGEAAAFISVANMILQKSGSGYQIPDVQDLIMNSNLPDLLVFGGLSTMLGSDVSSSVSAPNVPQMFSAPAASFVGTAIKDVGSYLLNYLSGTVKEGDEMKAALAVAPSAMRGWIEELYSKEGQPVPRPNDKMRGNYIRDANEKLVAKLFSVKSLPEARVNAMVNSTKHQLAQDMNSKISILDAIADRLQNNQDAGDQLIQRYVELGGDASKILNAVQERMRERQMDYSDRQIYNKNLTPQQLHKLEVMKNLLDRQQKESEKKKPLDIEPISAEGEKPQQIGQGQNEIRRRQALINQYMDKQAEQRYNPVENEMTDKQKDELNLQKRRARIKELQRRKIEM